MMKRTLIMILVFSLLVCPLNVFGMETVENTANVLDAGTNVLTEEEKSFVKDIIDTKSDNATEKKETLFNKIKSECIETLNTLLESSDNDEKDGLKTIKGQINNIYIIQTKTY